MQHSLIIHIKLYRGNYFIVISDRFGKVFFTKSSGNLGFKHIQKRSTEAFDALIAEAIKFLLGVENPSVYLKLEGVQKKVLKEIHLQFLNIIKKYKINVLGFKVINKIPHNGCKKKFR